MLIASSRAIVGAMNSHATERSPSVRRRRASTAGVASAIRSATVALAEELLIAGSAPAAPPRLSPELSGESRLMQASADLEDLAFVLEDGGPVLDQRVERFLRRALVGH